LQVESKDVIFWSCSWRFLFETVLEACMTTKTACTPVLLNPAPAAALPDEVYDMLAHLVLNETEIVLLAEVSETDLEDMSVLERVAAFVLAKGVQHLVGLLGGRVAHCACKDGRHRHVPAMKVNVVDTTAAGDTLVGMYAVLAVEASSREEEFDVAAAVPKSIVVSSTTVAGKGAQVSNSVEGWVGSEIDTRCAKCVHVGRLGVQQPSSNKEPCNLVRISED
jgi:ribokinase